MIEQVPSLRRSFVFSFVGNAVFAASLWGMLIVLTKLGSPADVGRYALASAIATPVLVFANLQLRSLLIADTAGEHPFGEYLGVRLVLLPLGMVVLAAVALLGYDAAQVAAILAFGLVRLVEGISDIFHGLAQRRERLDLVAGSLVIKGVAGLALFATSFALTSDLIWSLLALSLGWSVALVGFDIPRCRRLLAPGESMVPRWRPVAWRRVVWTALPLGLAMLLIQMRLTIPRTLLEKAHGEAQLGIFAAVSYLVLVGNTVVMALSQAGIARLARAWADRDAALFAATLRKLVAIGAALGAAGVLVALAAGRPLLTLFYDRNYAQHQGLLLVVMIAGGILYVGSLLGAPATAMKAFRVQLWIHAANTVLLVLVGMALIPRFGMMGAAWTTLAGSVWVTGAYAVVVATKIRQMRVAGPDPGRSS